MSLQQNARQNHNSEISDKLFDNMTRFLGKEVTNKVAFTELCR